LCREVPEAKQKVLTQQLRELEADGIVSRTVSGTRSLRVEYALTPYGKTLVRVRANRKPAIVWTPSIDGG